MWLGVLEVGELVGMVEVEGFLVYLCLEGMVGCKVFGV